MTRGMTRSGTNSAPRSRTGTASACLTRVPKVGGGVSISGLKGGCCSTELMSLERRLHSACRRPGPETEYNGPESLQTPATAGGLHVLHDKMQLLRTARQPEVG